MNDEPDKNSATPAILLTIVIVLVALYSSTYGMQTLAWIDGHRWAKADPWLKQVPEPLAAPSRTAPAVDAEALPAASKGSKAAGPPKPTVLDAFNYQFEVPWQGGFKQSQAPTGVEFRFDSGPAVFFNDPDTQLDTVALMRTTQASEYAAFQGMINDGTISTNYAFYNAVYQTSPAAISPLSNYAVAQRSRLLLLTKLSFGPDLAGSIYSFDYGNNRGFQFGDPDKGPVAVRVFNSHDRQFRFLFTVFTLSTARITQGDIDQAVQSLETEPFETK